MTEWHIADGQMSSCWAERLQIDDSSPDPKSNTEAHTRKPDIDAIDCPTRWPEVLNVPNGSTSMHQVEVPDAPDVPKEVQDVPEIPNGSARDTKWKYQIWEIPDGAISWTQMNSDVFVFFEKWEWRSYSVLLQ